MAQFEIKDMSFYYPTAKERPALSGINLKIEQGQYVTVCGRSGSGKTTLLKHLKSVLAPHGKMTGEILFEGKPLKDVDLRTQSSKIGYVMQNPDNQIVTDKVWHELAFGLESLGVDQKTIRLRVAEMASYFGIHGWFHKNVNELSGGQKQLLNLASIMAMQPSVLILDEPTSQLDPIAASDFLNTVKKINRELRTTIIITEHRLEDIYYCSDKVVVIENGKMIAEDEPRRVGDYLQKENNEMFVAMPTPVQIYYGVKEGQQKKADAKNGAAVNEIAEGKAEKAKESAAVNSESKDSFGKCPLTVREGAEWLDELFRDRTPEFTMIEDVCGGIAGEGKGKKHADSTGAFAQNGKSAALSNIAPDNIENPAVLVKEAWFRYEKDSPDVLKGITLQVPRGSLYAIVGGNGTGKSTTLKTICNICRPYRGKVVIDGKKIEKYKSGELFDGVLAMLPQDPQSLFAKKTVREELEEMISGRKMQQTEKAKKGAPQKEQQENGKTGSVQTEIEEMARLCDIAHLMDSHPYDLSGGEQQRAALAKVLLTHPKILLLDEPTKGIDSFFKKKFAEIMEQLKQRGVTIIMVSHDVEFCARYADLVSMFFDGGIVTTNTPNRFFSRNSFYTTAANRMSRHVFGNAITNEDVITLCQKNL